jgi:hypothetical protein
MDGGGRVTQGAVAERVRERGGKFIDFKKGIYYPLIPSARMRE